MDKGAFTAAPCRMHKCLSILWTKQNAQLIFYDANPSQLLKHHCLQQRWLVLVTLHVTTSF